jgi:hypothetical protein
MKLLKIYFEVESHPRPKQPTTHQPGSKEKILVLRQRVIAGEALWHDRDKQARDDGQ